MQRWHPTATVRILGLHFLHTAKRRMYPNVHSSIIYNSLHYEMEINITLLAMHA